MCIRDRFLLFSFYILVNREQTVRVRSISFLTFCSWDKSSAFAALKKFFQLLRWHGKCCKNLHLHKFMKMFSQLAGACPVGNVHNSQSASTAFLNSAGGTFSTSLVYKATAFSTRIHMLEKHSEEISPTPHEFRNILLERKLNLSEAVWILPSYYVPQY